MQAAPAIFDPLRPFERADRAAADSAPPARRLLVAAAHLAPGLPGSPVVLFALAMWLRRCFHRPIALHNITNTLL